MQCAINKTMMSALIQRPDVSTARNGPVSPRTLKSHLKRVPIFYKTMGSYIHASLSQIIMKYIAAHHTNCSIV